MNFIEYDWFKYGLLSQIYMHYYSKSIYCSKCNLLENYILQSNATHKIWGKKQAHKTHKTKETQIYMVHPVWATSTLNNHSFLSIIQQNEETQPTIDPL